MSNKETKPEKIILYRHSLLEKISGQTGTLFVWGGGAAERGS